MTEKTQERGRGGLTKADREYLRGKKEYEHPETELHRKSNIRDRVRNSLRDFQLLLEELDQEERQKIFSDQDFWDDCGDAIAFICLGLEHDRIEDTPSSELEVEVNFPDFESVLRSGIRGALRQVGFHPIEVRSNLLARGFKKETLDVLKEIISAGEGAGPPAAHEVYMLMLAGEIDRDRLGDFLKEEIDPPR